MGIGGLGMWEIILIFLVVLLLFGAKRLPEIGASLGRGIREFKGSVREIEGELNTSEETGTAEAGTRTRGRVEGKEVPRDEVPSRDRERAPAEPDDVEGPGPEPTERTE